ncbi:MAG: GNAT family N-acetyltransferase [Lachnospiraceae bacterium]|nr:GNAT family N-acetyltransferase [Lachnospiraceae bacterium]
MLRLRPYKNSDASKVVSWVTSEEIFNEWALGEIGQYPPSVEAFDAFSAAKADDDSFFQMIASDDGTPVGYVTLSIPSGDPKTVHMASFVLDPEFYGHGYGYMMVTLALIFSFDVMKAENVTMAVFPENEFARRSYKGMGFADTGRIREIKLADRTVEAVEMLIRPDRMRDYMPNDNAVPEDEMIRDIIDENKFSYALQPIVDARTGEIFGYEALMRTDFGVSVSPLTILDYATRKNQLYNIEKQTLFNVMELYEGKCGALGNKKIFINSLPGSQLGADDFAELRSRYGQYFDKMILEITEYTEFKDHELSSLLERSESGGFELAIDDYGTGYSNTSSLLRYLPSYLKIDRLLISNIHEETKKQHFVKSIIEFAKANGVKTLAEGVETGPEMRTVIELGVDYIQGYYTGKPSFEIIEEVDESIKAQIISSSVKGTNQEVRRIYNVEGESELPIMRLALEKYTGILIGREEFTLVGNTGYCAEMSIKIKDNTKCRLTIRDVFIESTQQLPCIELGTGSELTLVLEGENRLNKFGILVPDSSKLVITGHGNLQIRAQGVSSYAIGNFWNSGVGDIAWRGTGSLDILIEADEAVAIGGGEFREGNGIHILSGTVRIEPASQRAIAIGAVKGHFDGIISNCKLHLDIKIDKGIGIGCIEGTPNIHIVNSKINIMCAGSRISAIGGMDNKNGSVKMENCELTIAANGQQLYLIGAGSGAFDIDFYNSAINLRGEGNNVLALGDKELDSHIQAKQTIVNIRLASGVPVVYGAKPENVVYEGGLQSISVNE